MRSLRASPASRTVISRARNPGCQILGQPNPGQWPISRRALINVEYTSSPVEGRRSFTLPRYSEPRGTRP